MNRECFMVINCKLSNMAKNHKNDKPEFKAINSGVSFAESIAVHRNIVHSKKGKKLRVIYNGDFFICLYSHFGYKRIITKVKIKAITMNNRG